MQNRTEHNRVLAKRQEVREVLDMIEKNRKTQEQLKKAFKDSNIKKAGEESARQKVYQREVKMRILKRKQDVEKNEQLHIDLIASMQPTAMEMHKFSRIMTKDKAFENESNYKVVTAIRTFKDKERLHYLLNNRLSGV